MEKDPAVNPATENKDVQQLVINSAKEYWREIGAALLVIIGGCLIFAYAQYKQDLAEEKAWNDFFMAEYESVRKKDDKYIERIQKALSEHKNTNAAFYARFQELSLYLTRGDLSKAEKTARRFIKINADNFFSLQVRLILAKILMSQGKFAEAMTHLNGLKNSRYLQPEVNLAIAQCLENKAEAMKQEDPSKYKQLLEGAREGYLQADAKGDRNWPRQVQSVASFALVMVQDRITNPVTASYPSLLKPESGPDAKKTGEKSSPPSEGTSKTKTPANK